MKTELSAIYAESFFKGEDFRLGEEYYHKGLVSTVVDSGDLLSGFVEEKDGLFHDVLIKKNRRGQLIHFDCSCHSKEPCHHAAAVLHYYIYEGANKYKDPVNPLKTKKVKKKEKALSFSLEKSIKPDKKSFESSLVTEGPFVLI